MCQDNRRLHLEEERPKGTNIYGETTMFQTFYFVCFILLNPHLKSLRHYYIHCITEESEA